MNCSLYEQPLFRQAAGPEFRPGGLALTDELASECGLEPGAVVLDLACGVGSTASQLARSWGVTMVGLDCSPGFIEEARARDPEVSWVVGRADAIPYANGHFDAVFCECFLSTVDEPAKVLREVRRVLRPGGRLAMSDMYLRQPGAAPSSREIPLLERTGFAVRTWRDRSDTLKTLIASLIFAYGSAAAFWAAACGADEGGAHEGDAGRLAAAKPGYYLLVAQSPPDVATESRDDR
jgi:arsenite methyltransferase